jgi:hypothetical protein
MLELPTITAYKILMHNNASRWIVIAILTTLMSGCGSSYADRMNDTLRIVAIEAEKVSRIQLGMTISEVQTIMGPGMLNIDESVEARPIRKDKFTSKEGDQIEIFYYRSSVKRNDGFCTDDETTAVIFVKGKVDAITSGDTSKTVIEVRRR